jgi:hypothetical protein
MNAPVSTTEFKAGAIDIPAAAFAAKVRRDLLAECGEMLLVEAARLLTACRYDDDALIVEQFRRLDTVYRTAKLTASDIRDSIGGRK